MLKRFINIYIVCTFATTCIAQNVMHTKVLVVGGGAGGIAAGLQCARMGVPTIIAEETTWLGGMLSAAGVTAIDGNHKLPSGIWNEFREALYKHYNTKNLMTGWVSNTQFEPHVADSIFKALAKKEQLLSVVYNYLFEKVLQKNNTVIGAVFKHAVTTKTITIYAKQTIDATELGDVLASAKVPCSIGMEADAISGENAGIVKSNNIIQDLTYAAILKDYGIGANKTIAKPANYNPEEFDAACTNYYNNTARLKPTVDAQKMLDYGKLPNNKYMLNWPGYGNDYHVNLLPFNRKQRDSALVHAKEQTYRFIYFIQTQLGLKHIGIADDEFGTNDKLPLIAYHRESRRLKGLVRFNSNHIAQPYQYNLYKTGIAVGDYPIDHHHRKNPDAPTNIHFKAIPSFNIPIGSVIPANTNGLLVAEKNISVSNIVNGTTRLQPCVLTTGQAVGVLAALAVLQNKQPKNIAVRQVQQALLNSQALIMPYIDAGILHPHFIAIQKIGATGILRGKGIPNAWANQTWFYPDSAVLAADFKNYFKGYGKAIVNNNVFVTIENAIATIQNSMLNTQKNWKQIIEQNWSKWQLTNFNLNRNITKAEMAVLLNNTINPFIKPINYLGN
jgi:FAD dependent oxidoreductase